MIGNTVGQELNRAEGARQFDVSARQQDERTDLDAAKSGFERSPREQQLKEEMDKGSEQPPLGSEAQKRLKEQAGKPMEMDRNQTWRETEGRKEAQRSDTEINRFKADTERMRALAYRDQVGVAAQKAKASGNMEVFNEKAKELTGLPNSRQKQYDRLMKDSPNANDWAEMSKAVMAYPDVEPTLVEDIKTKMFTPRVQAFVRSQIASEALKSVVLTKGSTKFLEIDETNPKWIEFLDQRQAINAKLASNPALRELASINSTADKMDFLNVLAAARVLTGQSTAPNPAGGMAPATTAPPQAQPQQPQAPQIEQTQGTARPGAGGPGVDAINQARGGGASPQEALQAGQRAQPTAVRPAPEIPKMGGFGPK